MRESFASPDFLRKEDIMISQISSRFRVHFVCIIFASTRISMHYTAQKLFCRVTIKNKKRLIYQGFLQISAQKSHHLHGGSFDLLVELRGIEPLSESNLTGTSPGADDHLHSLTVPGIVTLYSLVASSCMVCAKLCIRTVTT